MKKIISFFILVVCLFFQNTFAAGNTDIEIFDNKNFFTKIVTEKQNYISKNHLTDFHINNISGKYIYGINGNITSNKYLSIHFDNSFNGSIEIELKKTTFGSIEKYIQDMLNRGSKIDYKMDIKNQKDIILEKYTQYYTNTQSINIDLDPLLNHGFYSRLLHDVIVTLKDNQGNSIILNNFYASNQSETNLVYSHNFKNTQQNIENLVIDNYFTDFNNLTKVDDKKLFFLEEVNVQDYQGFIKILFAGKNRIIIDTQKNKDLMVFLLGEDYKDYENTIYYNKYINNDSSNPSNLKVHKNGDKKYIKIPVTWYKKGDIVINQYSQYLHKNYGSIASLYYKSTDSYNNSFFNKSNYPNDQLDDVTKKISYLSKTFTYLIISYLFILFGSIFFFFNSWSNRYKNIYIIFILSFTYLIIYYLLYIIIIGKNDKIEYVVDRQIYDNFEIQTHRIYDFSLTDDNISLNNYFNDIFHIIGINNYQMKYLGDIYINKKNLNYKQIPLNTTNIKFNSILFDSKVGFLSKNNTTLEKNSNYFKIYSKKYSLPHKNIYFSQEKSDIYYDIFEGTDSINYFLIETTY